LVGWLNVTNFIVTSSKIQYRNLAYVTQTSLSYDLQASIQYVHTYMISCASSMHVCCGSHLASIMKLQMRADNMSLKEDTSLQ